MAIKKIRINQSCPSAIGIFKRKRSKRKSQVSTFVIFGIIALLFVIAGYFVYNNIRVAKIEAEAKRVADINLQAEEIEKYVNDCVRKVTFDGLKKLGTAGGYIQVPKLIEFKGTSFWYFEQANIQPFLNQTQESLIAYINPNLQKCVDSGNLEAYGFAIEKGKPLTAIEFGSSDLTVIVEYPIKLAKEKFSKEFSQFINTFDIRYRSIFEAATELNEMIFDADFDAKDPLKKVGYLKELSFDFSYKISSDNIISFTITDKESVTSSNELYTFSFAAKLGQSGLKKLTDMQDNSASNPTIFPYTIFSTDKKAQLDIQEGTTISKDGSDVEFISVQQTYPSEVVTKDVPTGKRNAEVTQTQDIKYVIDNPVYTFEPSGLLFNKPEKLTLYYDNLSDTSKGVGILMGKNDFWVPIPSIHEPEQKRVFSGILGFTHFTAINCASQPVKQFVAEHYFEPNAGCFVSLAIQIVVLIVAFFIIVGAAAAAAAGAGASGTVGAGTVGVTVGGTTAGGTLATAGTLAGTSGVAAPAVVGSVQSIGVALANGLNAIGLGGLVLGTSAATVGTLVIGISLISTVATIIGGTTDAFYGKSPNNCVTFYPSCDQEIHVQKEEKDGTGKCIPKESQKVSAGTPNLMCAQVQKCNQVQKFLCIPCSVKCNSEFY